MSKEDDFELCPYCGIRAETVCDEPPPDICEQAINAMYGSPTPPPRTVENTDLYSEDWVTSALGGLGDD